MPEQILSPMTGTVLPLADVPDPVFAQEIVGAGLAVQPALDSGWVIAGAPVGGTLVRVQPHAFVIQSDGGTGILVHIGIDTVRMNGQGFEVLAHEGSAIRAGDPVIRFDPYAITAEGHSSACPVIVLQSPPGAIPAPAKPTIVTTAQPLFSWPN